MEVLADRQITKKKTCIQLYHKMRLQINSSNKFYILLKQIKKEI